LQPPCLPEPAVFPRGKPPAAGGFYVLNNVFYII